jgi:hypothetical protein
LSVTADCGLVLLSFINRLDKTIHNAPAAITKRGLTMPQTLERNAGGVPVRELGNTGLKISIIGIGGGHFVRPHLDEQASVRLIQMAIDEGVTFMDNAWEYHQG